MGFGVIGIQKCKKIPQNNFFFTFLAAIMDFLITLKY